MKLEKQRILIPNYMQAKALQNLDETKDKSGLVVIPTGVGKTFMAAMWFKKKLEQNPKAKLLFICHATDVLIQANEKEFQEHLKEFGITYGYMMSNRNDDVQATFATVQTLHRRLKTLSPELFDYVVVDECHHYMSKTYREVVKHFKPKFLLGLTATPRRLDGLPLTELFGRILYEGTLKDAIERKLLTKINYWCVDHDIDFSTVKWTGEDYDIKDLNRKMCVSEYDEAIYSEWKEQSKIHDRKKTVAFCPTVRHAMRMEKFFLEHGVRAKAITCANIPHRTEARNLIVQGFRDGRYDIVFVRDMFNEGINVPDADMVMMLRPTRSHTIFTQQLGRGLRKSEGKEYLLALDFVGNARDCNIITEVLDDVLGIKIMERIAKHYENSGDVNLEPLVIESIGCSVRFSKKKMDILNSMFSVRLNEEKYRKIYSDMKKKFGRIPTRTDFRSIGIHPERISRMLGLDGTFNALIMHFGDEPNHIRKSMRFSGIRMTKGELIAKFKEFREKYGEIPTNRQFVGDRPVEGWDGRNIPSLPTIYKKFGSWKGFCNACGCSPINERRLQGGKWFSKVKNDKVCPKNNVNIISHYHPRFNVLPNKTNVPVPNLSNPKNGFGRLNLKRGFKDSLNKSEIRTKILNNIKDGDTVLLLESPQLLALKEIQRLGKKPKEIVIPNCFEFHGVSDALKTFETDLNITLVNTSALQYLVDTDIQYSFCWLDFCGNFSTYCRDLEILLKKQKQDMQLILTFNLFDLHNKDDAYYFAKVYTFIEDTAEVNGRKIKLMKEVCRHYKKMFYNMGFQITGKDISVNAVNVQQGVMK